MKIKEINNKSGIYTITNLIDNKIYIGFCQNFRTRSNDHKITLLHGKHGNEYLQRAYNKHGSENFIFEILEECDKEYLVSQENYWANMLNVHNRSYGYNIQPTHPNNYKIHSNETKIKISKTTKGIKKSETTKQKMSNAMRGKLKTKSHKINLSKSKIGKKMHTKTKESLKLANTGRIHSLEEKLKRANSRKNPIIQMDLNGNFIKEWKSAVDAKKELSIIGAHIYACCKGKRNSSNNFKWRYKL